MRDIGVGAAFDVHGFVSGAASVIFSTDILVFVTSRVCMMQAH
jgi:hypothetical protein